MRNWISKVVNVTSGKKKGEGEGAGPGSHGTAHHRHPRSKSGGSNGEELIKAQVITRICEHLVREIQRILRSAKEAQSSNVGGRWAGTNELLALLGEPPVVSGLKEGSLRSSSPAPSTKLEREDSDDSNSNLLGALEDLIDHPQFVARCLETALAPSLGHCLRLMRHIELEALLPPPAAPPQKSRIRSLSGAGSPTAERVMSNEPLAPPGCTMEATARVGRTLTKLCQESAIVEQLRHHLEGLFKLTTASYPRTGVHIQLAALDVIQAAATSSLSSSLVWFIHDRQIVLQLVDDMMELCQMETHDAEDGEAEGVSGGQPHDRRSNLAAEEGKGTAGGGLGEGDAADIMMSGKAAEEAGMWLNAMRAVITLVCHSCRYSAALLSDLQDAKGYDVFKHMLVCSSPERRPDALALMAQLVGAGVESTTDRHANAEDEGAIGQPARNVAAFEVLRDILLDSSPVLTKLVANAPVQEEERPSTASQPGGQAEDPPAGSLELATVSREAIAFIRAKGLSPSPDDVKREQLQLQLLSTVLQVYSNHPRNYSILEPRFQVLSLYLASLPSFVSSDLKVMVIKTLEYVCSGVANCVPTDALYAACYTFMTCCETFLEMVPPAGGLGKVDPRVPKELSDNVDMVCGTLEKLIQFDHQFVDVLCRTGVLGDVMYPLLSKAVQAKGMAIPERGESEATLNSYPAYQGPDDTTCLVCRLLVTMLHETPASSSLHLREARLNQVLYTIIGEMSPRSTQAALQVIYLAALADEKGLRDDLTCLIELLQSCRNERWRQLVVLKNIKDILNSSATANDLWRTFCGFEAAIAALSSLDRVFADGGLDQPKEASGVPSPTRRSASLRDVLASKVQDDTEEGKHLDSLLDSGDDEGICLEVIKQILQTIIISVSGKVLGNLRARVENKQYLKNEIGYNTLKCCLINSKVLLRERHSREVVECVFNMVTEEQTICFEKATIKNADAVLLLFSLLKELPSQTVAIYILQQLLQLISNSAYVATEQLCLAGALRQVVVQFRDILHDPDNPLYLLLLRLLCLSGRHRITVPDAVSILRTLAKPLFRNEDGRIVLCMSLKKQTQLHPELGSLKKASLEEQWKSLLILAELAETSDSVPFQRLGGARGDLLSMARKWAEEEPKEIAIMDFDSIYAATAYSEGMRFVMVPTVGGVQPSASSTGFTYTCWFRFGVEDTDFVISALDKETEAVMDAPSDAEDDGQPGIHQRILWLLTVSSSSIRSCLQVYLDLTHKQLCVESFVGKGLYSELIDVDLQPGVWHHFMLIHRRARNLLSNRNTMSVYLNGVEVIDAFKTDHVSFLESQSSRCFIGVPLPEMLKVKDTILRGAVSPIWHLGPVLLTSEALPVPAAATALFSGGPAYVGGFQGERPAHSHISAVVTTLLHRLHQMGTDVGPALAARGLQDVFRNELRKDDDGLLNTLLLRIPLEQIVFSFHAGHASPCEITPRNLSGGPGHNLDIYHEPCYRLVNTISHLSDEARLQWGVVFGDGVLMNPLSISDSVFGMGGPQVLLPLLEVADSPMALCIVLELIRMFCKGHLANLECMQQTGYRVIVFLLARKKALFTSDVLRAGMALAVDSKSDRKTHCGNYCPQRVDAQRDQDEEDTSKVLVDPVALKHLGINWELWGGSNHDIFITLLTELNHLLSPRNINAVFNAHRLHSIGMVRWTLSVMMQAAKLSSDGLDGWVLPRMTVEDAHWARSSSQPDKLLSLCACLLQRLLLIRMAEGDVRDIASVLLSTVAKNTGDAPGRGRVLNEGRNRHVAGNQSAANGSKEYLSPQGLVRICLLEILIKLLTREREGPRRTSVGGAQGIVKKVVDFLSVESERLGVKPAASFLVGQQAPANPGLIQNDRLEILKALSRCMTPEWFHSILEGSRDSLSVSLTLRALFILLQERDESVTAFNERSSGFVLLTSIIPKHSASPIVLLPVFAALVGISVSQVPILPDLRSTHIKDLLEPLSETRFKLHKSLFTALMTSFTESLGRNITLCYVITDDEVVARARYCAEEALSCLSSTLAESPQFIDAAKSREFIAPAALAIFACADVAEIQMCNEQTRTMRSATGLQVPLNSMMEEGYISCSLGEESPRPVCVGTPTTPGTPKTLEAPVAPIRPFFTGSEAVRLLRMLGVVLRDAIFSNAVTATSSASSLVREVFVAFPHTALEVQIYSFQESVLALLGELVTEALAAGEIVPVSNTVAIAGVLYDNAQNGLFPPAILLMALELTLKVAREIAGTRTNKALGNDLQQLLLADAVAISQAFAVVALRRCAMYDDKDTGALLSIVSQHMNLLLSHVKRPMAAGQAGSTSQRPSQNSGWRKALASTLSGNIDESTDTAPSPAVELGRSVTSILRSDASRVDVFQSFGPDKEEAFVTCLLAEIYTFLSHDTAETRRTALRICDVLLKQRQTTMTDLLTPELRDRKTKEKRTVDIYSKGFALLQEPGQTPALVGMGDDDAVANVKYRRFEFWLKGEDVADDVQQVFSNVQDKALAILPDDQVSTVEVLKRLQDAKVNAFSTALQASRAATNVEYARKACEEFILFHQHIIRSGQADIANGSLHWKRIARALRGAASLWEGPDMYDDIEADKWAVGAVDQVLATNNSEKFRWKLDMTEGPERMRRRLKRNLEFEEIFNVVPRAEHGHSQAVDLLAETQRALDGEGQGGGETGSDAAAMIGLEGGVHEDSGLGEEFDLEATTKLLKQVALVRKNSGVGHHEDEDDDLFDDDDESVTKSVTDDALEIDMTEDGGGSSESERGAGGKPRRRTSLEPGSRLPRSARRLRSGVSSTESAEGVDGDLRREQSSDSLGPRITEMSDVTSIDISINSGAARLGVSSTSFDDRTEQDDTVNVLLPDVGQGVQGPGSPTRASKLVLEASNSGTSGSLALLAMEAMADDKDIVCNELISGFVDEADGGILRVHNVQRCTGLEIRPALLLICRHAIVVVDGFAKIVAGAGSQPAGPPIIRKVPLYSTKSTGWPSGNASNVPMRYSVHVRDPEDAEVEFSDSVRLSRGKSDTPSPQAIEGGDGVDHLGFDLEQPPHVEKMRFDRLKILYKRKYQFRHVGLEFFDVDGRSFLVACETPEEQGQVMDFVLEAPIVNSVFAQDGAKIGSGKINYKRFIQGFKQQMLHRWQSGKITNFDYLMHLNALAGRSFHDLTQYPVFPWILSDYTSSELNLNDPSVYRDLRKPMGALGEARARQFIERYEQLASLVEDLSPEQAEAEAPAFHYGTHYSCAGYVLYYLVRLEPYTRMHLQLQGGKFDKSDRLFRDIKSSWDSASRENLQDVRELIPEFFYLPDFLVNHNNFDYGWLQKGLPVNHVMLPPWAQGDAREFVRLQRMALESKYVSENLNHWIDLIFGCKQTGKEAVEAQNLFVHLTYEGVVDIDAIQDPVIREATLAQIHNFGQTPSRLFKRAHPARKVPTALQAVPSTDGAQKQYVDQAALTWLQHTTPALCIVGAPGHIALKATSASQIGPPMGGAVPSPIQPVGDVWVLKDRAVGVGLDCLLVPPNLVKYSRYGSPDYGITFRVAVATARHRDVDRVVSVHEQLHLGPVNCMAIDDGGELAVTGSKDSTVRLWSLIKHSTQKTMSLQATFSGHGHEVLCVDIAPTIGYVLSGGADRLAIVWDIREATSQHILRGHTSPVTSASINKRTGDMVTLAGVDIRMWSVTGEPLAQVSAVALVKEVPTCVSATSSPEWQNGVVCVTGHDKGKVCLWGMQNLSSDGPSRAMEPPAPSPSPSPRDEVRASNTGTIQGRQLKVMQVLQGIHQAAITAVRVGREQRDIAVGDATGKLSRWSSVRVEQLSEKELAELR